MMTRVIVRPFKKIDDAVLHTHMIGPETGSEMPAVVFFFCGGWNGFQASKFYLQSTYLSSRGVVCLNAEVRVKPEHGTTPRECVVDAKSALRWVRSHAEELGIRHDRIVAAGGSAAGHVSACCGLIEGFDDPQDEDLSVSSRPDALVLFNPALDALGHERRIKLFGGLEAARALCPLRHVTKGAPPALVMHGREDETVDVAEAMRFEKAMREAGNRCDLRLYDGEGHGFFNYFDGDNPMFKETLKETDTFLASLGYIEDSDQVDAFSFDSEVEIVPA